MIQKRHRLTELKCTAIWFHVLLTMVAQTDLAATGMGEGVWSSTDPHVRDYLDRQKQMKRNKHILLGWGAVNMASGLALYATDHRDFGVMNASWGAINAGIALLAMRDASQTGSVPSHAEMLREEQQFNRIVALNTGLDVGYMIAGLWMMTEGRDSMVRQYGTSILVQGAFLFAYDLWLTVESTRYLNRLTLSPTLNGVSVTVRW